MWSLVFALMLAPVMLAVKADSGASLAPDTQAAWDNLKKLDGEWEGTGNGSPAKVIYRLVSNGNTVMETLFPGTPHEMITMYHLDGPQLVLTHYCAAGNQPRMTLDKSGSKPGYLVFAFSGGSNMDPKKDGHIHSGRIKVLDLDHIESEWDYFENDKLGHSMKFVLARKR